MSFLAAASRAACECAAATPSAWVSNLLFRSAIFSRARHSGTDPCGVAACGAPMVPLLSVPSNAAALSICVFLG
eukprot:1951509-Prymnesium_polylepis.1